MAGGSNLIGGKQGSAVRATVAHRAVTQDMPLTVGIFVFHFHGDNFTNIRCFAHRDHFGDVQIHRVSVFLNRRLLLRDISWDFACHGGYAHAAEG